MQVVLNENIHFNTWIMLNQRLWLLSAASMLLLGAIAHPAQASVSPLTQPGTETAPLLLAQRQRPEPSGPAGQQQGRPRRRIDFAAAAARLGTTEANLREALGLPAQPRTPGDRANRLREAADQLNVSEERLRQALGITLDPQTGQPVRPRTRPNLPAAATQLGVTETQLRTALGLPEPGEGRRSRPRLDIQGAASRLGVTEQQLREALGIPARPADNSRPNRRSN